MALGALFSSGFADPSGVVERSLAGSATDRLSIGVIQHSLEEEVGNDAAYVVVTTVCTVYLSGGGHIKCSSCVGTGRVEGDGISLCD